MPVYDVKMKFEADGVAWIKPEAGKVYHLKIRCANCGEESGKFSTLTTEEEVEVPGGRGTAHLVQKCKMCERQNNVTIVERKEQAEYTKEHAEGEEYVTMVSFECRGVELVEFSPMDGWEIKGTTQVFHNVDLSEGEFAEFDEEADESVTILSIDVKVEVSGASDGKSNKRKGKGKKKK